MKRNDLMFPVNPEGLDDVMAELLKPPKEDSGSRLLASRVLDQSPAENGADKTQDQWIEYWNGIVGKYFASMPDFYLAGKSGNEKLLKSLQEDFKEWVTSSTRTRYNPDSLKGTIIHYFGSKIIKPVENKIIIPDYSGGTLLDEVLNSEEGLAYLRTLFKTGDNAEGIRKTLKKLSNYNPDKTKIWTPSQGSRESNLELAAYLHSNNGEFHVACDFNPGNGGRSRGVLVSTEGGPKNGGSR